MLGKTALKLPTVSIIHQLNKYIVDNGLGHDQLCKDQQLLTFYRLKILQPESIYYSSDYKRVKRRNSYTVMYMCSRLVVYGQIKYFILVGSTPLAVVRKACPQAIFNEKFSSDITSLNKIIIPVSMLDAFDVVSVHSILEKCMYVQVSSTECYIVRFPNTLSHD